MERRHFQWPWTTPNLVFKVTPFFDTENLTNGTTYSHKCHWNTNRDLHTTYATVSFQMTLSDLAKYSMTRSVAQSSCDSWASCWMMQLRQKSGSFAWNKLKYQFRKSVSQLCYALPILLSSMMMMMMMMITSFALPPCANMQMSAPAPVTAVALLTAERWPAAGHD